MKRIFLTALLKELAGLRKLLVLELAGTEVTEAGLKELAELAGSRRCGRLISSEPR